jgi:hypothetical protein
MYQKRLTLCMGALISITAILFGRSHTNLAEELPKSTTSGDYSARTSHRHWVVVDPDPDGVNCRWSSAIPANWYDPGVKLPLATIDQWPVVRTYKRNSVVTSNITPAGFAILPDTQNRPWLKVSIGPNDQICLVRANSKYVRPYQK